MPDDKFQRGCGEASASFSDNGFMGLLIEPLLDGATVSASDIAYGILFDGSWYYSVLSGVSAQLATVPTFGNRIRMKLEGGYISFYEDATLIWQTTYNYNEPAHYFAFGLQKTAQTVTDPYFNPYSFASTDANGDITYNDFDANEYHQIGAVKATIFTMILNSDLALLLGFRLSLLKGSAVQKTFQAVDTFKDSSLAESVEIHFVNAGDFKSYDSVTKKQQQIIGVTPLGSAVVGSKISYSFPELMYVDINNKYEIPLSTMTFRIVGSSTGEELVFEGGITLTLAIKPKNER